VEGLSPGKPMADLASMPAAALAPVGGHWGPDELPDGLVIADHAGRVCVFNRAAGAADRHFRRLTCSGPTCGRRCRCGTPTAAAGGCPPIPTRACPPGPAIPEMSLYLPDGTELLVTVGYVRGPRCGPEAAYRSGPGPCAIS
jgi:hypothetical protein